MFWKISAVIVLVIVLGGVNGFTAQSTDDVTVSPEKIESARKQILGARVQQIARQDQYIIGHGDILSVSIFEEGDMAASELHSVTRNVSSTDELRRAPGVQVMMDGRISLKHIGDVEVVGLTLTELANLLKEFYVIIYENPIITTTLVQSNSLRYTVIGNVVEPGIFYLDYPLTIVQTIARSGGFTEWTDKTLTLVREKLDGTDQKLFKDNKLTFDYDDFVSGKNLEKNILIKSGDVINVN